MHGIDDRNRRMKEGKRLIASARKQRQRRGMVFGQFWSGPGFDRSEPVMSDETTPERAERNEAVLRLYNIQYNNPVKR